MMPYAQPRTLLEALDLLSDGRWTVLSGGTDVFPAHAVKPLPENVLDVSGLQELQAIDELADEWALGAGVTWAALRQAVLPQAFAALQAAGRDVGGVQIQARGTVGGNLCNASPAADGVPPLLVLDAAVELRSAAGLRRLPLSEFVHGNRQTARRPDELLTRILVPKASALGCSAFEKLGARRYLVISVAMCAARLVVDERGLVQEAALAIGACSPVARRLFQLENDLLGCRADGASLAAAVDASRHLSELSPIDDVRASAAYRREAAAEILRRALVAAARAAPTASLVQAAA